MTTDCNHRELSLNIQFLERLLEYYLVVLIRAAALPRHSLTLPNNAKPTIKNTKVDNKDIR